MNVDPQYVFFAVFGAFAIYSLYQIATKGFKGAMFGGRISRTYGEIELDRNGIMGGSLKVHKVASESGPSRIGIELVNKSLLSYRMVPATMSREEARHLIQLLTTATNEPDGTGVT